MNAKSWPLALAALGYASGCLLPGVDTREPSSGASGNSAGAAGSVGRGSGGAPEAGRADRLNTWYGLEQAANQLECQCSPPCRVDGRTERQLSCFRALLQSAAIGYANAIECLVAQAQSNLDCIADELDPPTRCDGLTACSLNSEVQFDVCLNLTPQEAMQNKLNRCYYDCDFSPSNCE